MLVTPPADLNGLVRFPERLNLVSAHVPSHFKRSLPQFVTLLRGWQSIWQRCVEVFLNV